MAAAPLLQQCTAVLVSMKIATHCQIATDCHRLRHIATYCQIATMPHIARKDCNNFSWCSRPESCQNVALIIFIQAVGAIGSLYAFVVVISYNVVIIM